jgi:hypothetical protein
MIWREMVWLENSPLSRDEDGRVKKSEGKKRLSAKTGIYGNG